MTVQPSRSPARLRNFQLAGVAAVVLFALVAISQVLQVRSDLADAPQLTTQAVRISQLGAELDRSGRIAATTVLSGGDSGDLDTSLARAADLVVRAAAAGADSDKLAAVNNSLGSYGALLREAAATKDHTAAARLLGQAETVRNDHIDLALGRLQEDLNTQASANSWLGWALVLGGIAVIGVLGWAWFQTALLSHRVVNAGLALAALLTVGITVLAVNAVNAAPTSGGNASSLQQTAGLAAIETGVESSARIQATSVLARTFTSDQSAAEAAARQAASKAVSDDTPEDVRRAASSAAADLKRSAALLAASTWSQAGDVLLGTGDSTVPDELSNLASACAAANQDLLDAADQAPANAAGVMIGAVVGLAVLAVAAAVAVIWGVGARLKEYQ